MLNRRYLGADLGHIDLAADYTSVMRLAALLTLFAVPSFAASHPSPRTGSGQNANGAVSIEATVYGDPDSVKNAVTDDLGGHYIVVRVKLAPKTGTLPVQLDDFLLKTDKDGERSHAYAPTQIAGQGVLIVSQVSTGGGGGHSQAADPTYGGLPPSGGGFGNAASTVGAQGKMKLEEKENPLVKTLADRMLPEKEISGPVTGLLYFPMEKQRVKDLELTYTTPMGKLTVRFK